MIYTIARKNLISMIMLYQSLELLHVYLVSWRIEKDKLVDTLVTHNQISR